MRPTSADDDYEQLVKRMVALDADAYAEFAEIFGPRIRTYFIRRGLDVSTAEDLAVTCITDIVLKIHRYEPVNGGSFQAWVFTLARRAMIDWWRARREELTSIDDLTEAVIRDEPPPPNLLIIQAVNDNLAKLSDTDQTIIRLRYCEEELTYGETGERLGISPETARVRCHRALKRLQALLLADARICNHLRGR